MVVSGMVYGRGIMSFFKFGTSPSSSTQSSPIRGSGKPGSQLQPQSSNDDPGIYHPPLTAPLAPTGASIAPFNARNSPPVYFYEKGSPFYEFTNFSPHAIFYKGLRYPTSEHLFQSFKFIDGHPNIAERIRTCGERPMLAFDEAHRSQKWVRSDWRQVNVEKMEVALRLKFTQHPDLKAMLLGTGDAELVEDSPKDYFWGIGADRSGRNELGKALERLREELRHEDDPGHMPHVRRDANRLSVQDLTSLASNANTKPSRFSVALTSSASLNPSTTKGGSLCEFCCRRPKYPGHPYCGRTCAGEAAKFCRFCRVNRKSGSHQFCSRACAAKAKGSA